MFELPVSVGGLPLWGVFPPHSFAVSSSCFALKVKVANGCGTSRPNIAALGLNYLLEHSVKNTAFQLDVIKFVTGIEVPKFWFKYR